MNEAHEPILFLGGAGLPAWIWADVQRELGDGQQSVVAGRPTSTQARLDDYVQAALGPVPAGSFAVVAHSGGGVMAAEVARRVPERVTAFLGLSAVIPPAGGSFLSAMPVPSRWVLSAVMRFGGTRPPDSAIRGGLAHGLDEQVTNRIVADFVPESAGYYRDRTGRGGPVGWRGYVRTTGDRELSPALQRRFAGHLDATWHEDLDTGHLPMIEKPRAVAGLITRFLDARP